MVTGVLLLAMFPKGTVVKVALADGDEPLVGDCVWVEYVDGTVERTKVQEVSFRQQFGRDGEPRGYVRHARLRRPV